LNRLQQQSSSMSLYSLVKQLYQDNILLLALLQTLIQKLKFMVNSNFFCKDILVDIHDFAFHIYLNE